MRSEATKTIRLALPIIIGELAQMSLHLIDAAMVGAISYKQLAAAALVLNTLNIPFVFGIGITISVSQMVSMAHGRRDGQLVSHYFFNGFCLCALSAILISLLLVFGRNILYHLGQDPEVVVLALPFMKLMGLSIIPMLLFMTLKQFTDGLEFTRTAMMLSLIGLPINIFLNWVLIYGNLGFPRLELLGAGWATLITRSLIFIILGLVILKHSTFKRYVMVAKSQWKIRPQTLKELLHIGIPSSLQMGMEAGAFAVSGIIIGTLGAVSQASHQIALSCASFTFMASMGLAQAGSIRVSNAFGRMDFKMISKIGNTTLITALFYGIFCAIAFTVFRFQLPEFFNTNKDVLELASTLLLFAAVFQISDSTQAIGAGLLRGIKDVKVPTILVAISYWVIGLPVGYVLAFQFKMGASGMWLGLITGLTLASVFLVIRFLKMSKRNLIAPK
ncbi:Multidrug and toxin extrusion (MATE) family efflux pump YdhE/NorM [Arcticibacter svalbardensis MN12-7]|uniref:Multidrug-efflux transporter n=1 Tax=Arcticibacter svalbardensis MN12-7 TaxID=1150600 RepID=R9GST7_9SPHI|nr:MATE family efflux transporter [Arcticibacter svalbardensis]EOR94771.1 Multidrug and toxin extrusion (MATE) family efflux pump YdhE/NorM [Arcticibacter svalbardensis MN12-7]